MGGIREGGWYQGAVREGPAHEKINVIPKGLESKVKNPKKPKLDLEQKEQIRSWIESDPNITMKKLQSMIRKSFDIKISLVGIWKNVQKMDFAHITARSVHYKQDKEKLEEFKKNLESLETAYSPTNLTYKFQPLHPTIILGFCKILLGNKRWQASQV